MILISVDFPDPFSPARQWMERSSTIKVTSLSTGTRVNVLEICSVRIEAKGYCGVGSPPLVAESRMGHARPHSAKADHREWRSVSPPTKSRTDSNCPWSHLSRLGHKFC